MPAGGMTLREADYVLTSDGLRRPLRNRILSKLERLDRLRQYSESIRRFNPNALRYGNVVTKLR